MAEHSVPPLQSEKWYLENYDPKVYDARPLLDALMVQFNLKNDAALSRALDVQPPIISKIWHRKMRVTAWMFIRMHECSDRTIKELQGLLTKSSTA